MTSAEKLRKFVGFAMPKYCEFGEENFAGDPLVRTFCEILRDRHGIDFHVFVSWACPPDVKILQNRDRSVNAVIRSERLDTLLVEYLLQRKVFPVWEESLGRAVIGSGVLRWMCEFLIGYRQPELAIFAETLRPKLDGLAMTNPFRDETLASLPMFERTALQCFSIAHEFGHLMIPKRTDVTLEEPVDGISIEQHMTTGEQRESGHLRQEMLRYLADVRAKEIDAPALFNEIEVDLFALGTLFEFLYRAFECSIEQAIDGALLAFECQAFLYGCKGTCQLLARRATGALTEQQYRIKDYVMGVELVMRARAILRRAGLIWAHNEVSGSPEVDQLNDYVGKMDSKLGPTIPFRTAMATSLGEHVTTMLAALGENEGEHRILWQHNLMSLIDSDYELRVDLYFILIAFGLPGGVDVSRYMKWMGSKAGTA